MGSWENFSQRKQKLFDKGYADISELAPVESALPSSPAISGFSIPRDVEVRRKDMRFGSLEGPVDDPFLRRQDLTGLHLTCTTITVRKYEGSG